MKVLVCSCVPLVGDDAEDALTSVPADLCVGVATKVPVCGCVALVSDDDEEVPTSVPVSSVVW